MKLSRDDLCVKEMSWKPGHGRIPAPSVRFASGGHWCRGARELRCVRGAPNFFTQIFSLISFIQIPSVFVYSFDRTSILLKAILDVIVFILKKIEAAKAGRMATDGNG